MENLSKEKQIEEMAKELNFCKGIPYEICRTKVDCKHCLAEQFFNAGYRKPSEGHWCIIEYEFFTCSECGHYHWNSCDSTAEAKERLAKGDAPNFCPNCGAKMKGGAE